MSIRQLYPRFEVRTRDRQESPTGVLRFLDSRHVAGDDASSGMFQHRDRGAALPLNDEIRKLSKMGTLENLVSPPNSPDGSLPAGMNS